MRIKKVTMLVMTLGLLLSISLIPSVQCQSVSEEIIERFNLEDFEEDVKIDSLLELILYLFAIIWNAIFGPPMWP